MTKAQDNLQKAICLIDENIDRAHITGEKSESSLSKAEKALCLSFPPSYRLFLKKYGTCAIAGEEFYGITKVEDYERSTIPNGIWNTLDNRKTSNLPEKMILIYDVGDGEKFALDLRQQKPDGEAPVVAWTPGMSEPEDKLEIIAEDFGTFLYETVERALMPDEDIEY